MAGRLSTTVAAAKASKIFENTGSLPVVLAINAISADNTKNPQCNIVIDTNNAHSLNFIEAKKTLAQGVNFATGGFDLQSTSAGTTILHPTFAGINKQRISVNGTSYSETSHMKYVYFDSYFLENPAAYNKSSAYNLFMIASNDAYLKTDLQKDRSYFTAWLQGGSASSGDTANSNTTLSYYQARSMHDVWTDCLISFNTNAYMTQRHIHTYVPSTGNVGGIVGGNRTSDAFYYGYSGSSYNPADQEYDDGLRLDAQSDGGVFVIGLYPSKTTSQMGMMGMLSARQYRDNGNAQPVGTKIKNSEDANTSQGDSSLVNTGQVWHARFTMSGNGGMVASWFKYHPTEDKYYLNIQGGTSQKGIWSAFHDTIFVSGWGARNFEDIWTKETGLTHDLTDYTSQPERIGASLWVCFKGANQSQALYSTDLKNWKTAAEHSGISNAVLLASDVSNDATYFLKSTEQTKLFGTNSGFSLIPQQGLIENGVGVGTFERNGLVLNAGDCLYLENKDTTTSIHTTVTFLEV